LPRRNSEFVFLFRVSAFGFSQGNQPKTKDVMMKKSVSRACSTLLVVGLALCLCPGNAEGNRDLPGDAVVYVKTSALTDAFGGIESFAVGAVRNTPMAMMVMPGMLRMQVVQMSGMAPDFFDFAQSAEVLVWQAQPPLAAEAVDAPVAFVFPAMDYGANLKRIEARGMVLKTDGDGVTAVSPKPDAGGKTFFMSNLGEGRTLAAFSRDGVERYKASAVELSGKAAELPKGTIFQAEPRADSGRTGPICEHRKFDGGVAERGEHGVHHGNG
jgi:hypothetical protein